MKRFLALFGVLLMCVISTSVFAQDPPGNQEVKKISELHQQTIYLTSVGLRLTDSDASGGPYGSGEDYVVTLYDTNCSHPNRLCFRVDEFNIHPSDTLYIHDGPNTASPLLYKGNNSNSAMSEIFYATGARSPQSAMPTFPRSTMPTPSQSSMQPPTPPLDEIDSGYMADEFDEMLPDELDDIEGLLENESDDFLPDELDRYSDEELSGYFSAYPEDADDQTPSPNTYADTQPTAAAHPNSVAAAHPNSVAATPSNSVAAATETNTNPETEAQFVGFLEVTARTGDGAKPVEAALVIVSSTDEKGERLEFTALTDSSGTARLFNLPAANPVNTESPDMPDRFILYNVSISKPGYFDMVSTGVPLIGGITSRQDFRMIPLPEGISSDTIEFDNTEPQDLN